MLGQLSYSWFTTVNDMMTTDDPSIRLPHLTLQTLIGITVAIAGNVLISLALNTQKLAHLRLDRERRNKIKNERKRATEARGPPRNGHCNHLAQGSSAALKPGGSRQVSEEDLALETQPLIHPRSSSVPPASSNGIRYYGTSTPGDDARSGVSTNTGRSRRPQKRHSFVSQIVPSRFKFGIPFKDPVQDNSLTLDSTVISVDGVVRDWSRRNGNLPPVKRRPSSGHENGNESDYLRSKLWWLGFIMMNVGETGNFISYAFAPASVVAPLGTRDLLGILLAVVGASTVVLSSPSSDGATPPLTPSALLEAITQRSFVIFSIVYAVCAIILGGLSEGPVGKRIVVVDVGLCAIFGGFTVLATKAVSTLLTKQWVKMFTEWITYPILGIRYLNRALKRFDSKIVIPTQFVLFTLSAVVGSAVLYGDFRRATFHQMVTFLYGCAATFAGVYVIAWGPAPNGSSGETGGDVERGINAESRSRLASITRTEGSTSTGPARSRTGAAVVPKGSREIPMLKHKSIHSSSVSLAMPTVVAAFKNLIRKHHHPHQRHPDEHQDTVRLQPQQPHPQQQPQPDSPRQKAGQSSKHPPSAPESPHEPEMTVPEDREPKAKMPTYKGLENFKLLDKMGDGAFSNVYKAIDLTTNQKVAVKVVRKFELNASQVEVQIMRGINHPSIVKLLSFSESPEYYFLVLELMGGGELFHQIVKLTYFSENLSRHVILQVAHGIRYLHEERGVVHRDIKPENLLFERIPIIPSKNTVIRPYDEDKEDEGEFVAGVGGGGIGKIKIADFGLSKVVWNEETMTPCGTVGYTAPEIVKDERYSKSVDMWALGCVLYTLLCGFPPFYDESINVLTEKVARGYYTFLSPWWDDISDSGIHPKDLIQHLLCVDPAQRYTIDEFLSHPWCNEAPAPPPPPTPAAYVREPLDSPLLAAARGLADARSPGLATLKEAFDVTYAVHRMEEEGAFRRAYNGRGGAGTRGFLQGLNEEDEDSGDDESIVNEARQRRGEEPDDLAPARARADAAWHRAGGPVNPDASILGGRAGQRDRVRGSGGLKPFELDLDNATLLGRRHKKNPGVGLGGINISPLAQAAVVDFDGANTIPPGSPMHVL
ncbi:hypothetical protein ID866_1242 [Astraeus odoratus]|nr:hypothetical protein ID866_1242 [Astraeus odoratus]